MEQRKITQGDLVSMFLRSNLQQASFNFERIHGLGFCYDMIPAIKPKHAIMREAALRGFSTATDLADYLVRRGLPFRDCHEIVGHAVKYGVDTGKDLAEMSLEELRQFSDQIEQDVFAVLTLEGSVNARNHIGGTAPAQVKAAVVRGQALLASR